MYMYTVYCNDICTYEHVHVVMYHDVVNDSYNIALLFRYIHFHVNYNYNIFICTTCTVTCTTCTLIVTIFLLHTVFDFENVPMSVSRNERKVSSQSEHSTSKSWMLQDNKGSRTKLDSGKKFGKVSMPSLHKSKYSFKVSDTVKPYKNICIKIIVRVLYILYSTVLYYTVLL